MPTAMAPEVLADPVGVLVDLVTRRQPGLAPGVVTDVVLGVAGGRVKQRRLAQTLSDRTDLLIDGRSPAPRVVGDLLIALRNAGAVNISLPVCAGCGKQLRTQQRRGQDWYCSVCGPRREPCAGCGKTRPICYRDSDSGPRCAHCPPADGQDPTQLVVDIVAAVNPRSPRTRSPPRPWPPPAGPVTVCSWRGRCKTPPNCSPDRARGHRSRRCSG